MSAGALPARELLLQEIEQAAVAFAREAGAELERRFNTSPAVRFKSSRGRDPVTDADIAAESMITARVAEQFPSHSFLGEEGGAAAPATAARALPATAFLWVVDPLDGTANFANGVPIFAVSIGVLQGGIPVVAALYTTFGPDGQRCTFHAHKGSGLKLDGSPLTRAGAAERGRLVGVPAGFEHRMRRRLLRRAAPGETRSLGSIAVELGLAACGRLAFAFFGGPKIWDVAAGILLVQEAGGRVVATDRGRWQRFSSFTAPPGRSLSGWRGSVLAGDAAAVREVLQRTRLRPSPLELLDLLLGPVRASRLENAARGAAAQARPVLALGRRATAPHRRRASGAGQARTA